MKSAIIIIAVLCVISAVAFLVLRGRLASNENTGRFHDWVKNPDYRRSTEEYFAARDAVAVPDDILPSDIQAMVDRLFVRDDNDFNIDKLRLVGSKATPQLIGALNDARTYTTRFPEGGHSLDPGSPFERICDLLEPICPPEAAKPLTKYAAHEDDHFRKHAAITLGNIGTAECINPMIVLLDDDDDYVRSYAMMGIERGIDANRGSEQFLGAMFPAIEALLDRRDGSVSDDAPKLLLSIDRERAIPLMLSDRFFSHTDRHLHYIIEAFNECDIQIPHDKLLPLLATLEPLIGDYPHDYDFAAGLIAYSHNPDADAESFLAKRMDSTNEKVAVAAAEGLSILSGVTDPSGFVFTLLDERGWAKLTKPQQHYYAVLIYDAEVNNGGHSQYFANSSGDSYETALEGLSAIGAKNRAAILTDAVQLFGKSGPSTDNDKRHEQIAGFSRGQDAQLDALDSRYYDCDEITEALLSSYALANRDHFSKRK